MKYIKDFKMFESSDSDEFIITDETTLEKFKNELVDNFKAYENGGSGQTFIDIVVYMVKDTLKATGKNNDIAYDLEKKLDYKDSEGINTYNDKEVCKYETSGHDGYGYTAEISDEKVLGELLNDIKKLLA